MSGMQPLFSSAPRIKIKLNGKTVAYAIGFNLDVGVNVVPIRTLGEYAILTTEPTLYTGVRGTLQVMKLKTAESRDATQVEARAATKASSFVDKSKDSMFDSQNGVAQESLLSQEGLALHLDPAKVLLSESFDLEVYMKVRNEQNQLVEICQFQIQDCRLISRNINIAVGQIIDEPLSFMGQLMVDKARDSLGRGVEKADLGFSE